MLQQVARRLLIALAATAFASCGQSSSPTSPTAFSGSANDLSGRSNVLIGAGDIGHCGTEGAEATARLLDRYPGTVFTAGDNAYPVGGMEEFQNCYEPTWGRHKSRTRPTPGNHEYMSGGSGYYGYFGGNAGPGGAGYYAYSIGTWRVIALNSEIPSNPGSAQHSWLRDELNGRRSKCTAVIWHRPLFSSGPHGSAADMRDVWRTLYEFDVDVVINAHDHTYERFAPQDPDGRLDTARGIRQFVVGTGGAPLYPFAAVYPNSEVRAAVWGVGMFTLVDGGYQWEFIPVDGAGFRDSGLGTCH
jgi:Calcineurin-like phosphoesterase